MHGLAVKDVEFNGAMLRAAQIRNGIISVIHQRPLRLCIKMKISEVFS